MTANTAVVYHCYEGDEVIYVGMTYWLPQRTQGHQSQSPWWASVTRVESTAHMPRREAVQLELAEIHRLQPRHNRAGRDGRDGAALARDAATAARLLRSAAVAS